MWMSFWSQPLRHLVLLWKFESFVKCTCVTWDILFWDSDPWQIISYSVCDEFSGQFGNMYLCQSEESMERRDERRGETAGQVRNLTKLNTKVNLIYWNRTSWYDYWVSIYYCCLCVIEILMPSINLNVDFVDLQRIKPLTWKSANNHTKALSQLLTFDIFKWIRYLN